MSLCQTLYGIDLKEEDFEEIALIGWELIGNKRTRIYKFSTCISNCNSQNNYSVQLPCNCDIIESITGGLEDWGYVTNHTAEGDYYSGITEHYIEKRKVFNDPLYQSGKLLKYNRVGDTLYFDKPYGQINVLYKGIELDDEGLPELTDKEALAIATYCAYIVKYKEGLMTNNSNIIQVANNLKQQWNVQCDQARTDQYLSQNDWNDVLDAKTCWNRKVYGMSWKPYK